MTTPAAGETAGPLDHVRDLLADSDALVRAVASGRRRNAVVPYRRVEVRYVDLKAGRHLQVTSYDETQAHTRNVSLDQVATETERLAAEPYASWHIETATETVQIRVSKKGKVLTSRSARTDEAPPDRSHDRRKDRRLDASDPVFRVLGITTADGEVKPSRMAKFRQVQDLLAALDPVVDEAVKAGPGDQLSAERPLRVVDLGCGNAYLTFGAFRYLSDRLGLPVHVTGIDVKVQSRAHNTDVADRLGVSDQLEFVQSPIGEAEVTDAPDLVLALHACDTATDDALARAVRWQTPVIVAAPCCHHDIQRQLAGRPAPDAYDLITRHSILRERLADVLTDALRAAVLRMVGYRVEVFEFVDSKHTPRNALIRAVRTRTAPTDEMRVAYERLTSDWGVVPELARQLAPDFPVLVRAADTGAEQA